MTGIVPNKVLIRPKRGFTPPVAEWTKRLIKTYWNLTKNGFVAEQEILDVGKLAKLGIACSMLPMYWYPMYQILLLEVWGREFVWGQSPSEIAKN